VCTGVVRVKGKLRDDANIVGEYLSANWLCLREDLCFDDNVSMVSARPYHTQIECIKSKCIKPHTHAYICIHTCVCSRPSFNEPQVPVYSVLQCVAVCYSVLQCVAV